MSWLAQSWPLHPVWKQSESALHAVRGSGWAFALEAAVDDLRLASAASGFAERNAWGMKSPAMNSNKALLSIHSPSPLLYGDASSDRGNAISA